MTFAAMALGFSRPSYPIVEGGTLTSDATYYYRTFTNSTDTLTIANGSVAIEILIIGGGGGGG